MGDSTHVAATSGPGLATAVHVGLAAAKSVAWSLGVPLYGVHHLAGHAAADILEHGPLPAHSIVLIRSEEHTSELQSRGHLVCRLLLEKKKTIRIQYGRR